MLKPSLRNENTHQQNNQHGRTLSGKINMATLRSSTHNITITLALHFLQTIGEIEKGRIGGTILVVSKHQRSIVMHALAHEAVQLNPNKTYVSSLKRA